MSAPQLTALVASASLTPAIAQNAALNLDVGMPRGAQQPCLLNSMVIISEQNLSWEVWLWGNTAGVGSYTYNLDPWLGWWSFAAADATTCTGDARYRYFIPDLNVPYYDVSGNGLLHLSVIPRGAAKTINTALVIKMYFAPMTNWS